MDESCSKFKVLHCRFHPTTWIPVGTYSLLDFDSEPNLELVSLNVYNLYNFSFLFIFCPNFWRAPLVDTFSKSRFGRCRVLPFTTMAWVPRHNAPSCAFRELPHASWRPRRQRVSQKGPRNAGKFGNFEFQKEAPIF